LQVQTIIQMSICFANISTHACFIENTKLPAGG
jgi:hypothetical protein